MADYRFLFFDIDHTLWDFESNSVDTLRDRIAKPDWQSVEWPISMISTVFITRSMTACGIASGKAI